MNPREIRAYNAGVRRVLALAEQTAGMLGERPHAETERTKAMVEALRTLAEQGTAMLAPEPRAVDVSETATEADDV